MLVKNAAIVVGLMMLMTFVAAQHRTFSRGKRGQNLESRSPHPSSEQLNPLCMCTLRTDSFTFPELWSNPLRRTLASPFAVPGIRKDPRICSGSEHWAFEGMAALHLESVLARPSLAIPSSRLYNRSGESVLFYHILFPSSLLFSLLPPSFPSFFFFI